ncbi:hypothetical protein Sjap_021910 [Stephania japonica]|uniref:Uncharacterized protein n=1 Tax=Stephania japonica TaxID=461633 RepID=A0AAP0EV28_9MAGN
MISKDCKGPRLSLGNFPDLGGPICEYCSKEAQLGPPEGCPKKLDKLERRTQKAIFQLMEEQEKQNEEALENEDAA